MFPKSLSEKWQEEGLLTQDQLQRMEADLSTYKKQRSSKQLTTFFSSIGALLIGLAALAFVAANWSLMTGTMRIGLFFLATCISFIGGSIFLNEKRGFPRVGFSFIFLAHLLFGVTLFLIGQQYHVGEIHWFFLLWILSIAPGIYLFNSKILLTLSTILFYVWLAYAAQSSFFHQPEDALWLAIFASAALITKGSVHMLRSPTYKLGKVLMGYGVLLHLIFFYFTTFEFTRERAGFSLSGFHMGNIFIGLTLLVGAMGSISLFRLLSKTLDRKIVLLITGIYLSAFLLMILFAYVPQFPYSTLLFSLFFFGATLLMSTIGYLLGRMYLVNLGMFWLLVFLLTKYVDYFWDLLPKSLFFLIGGVLLVSGGIFMEKKRKSVALHLHQSHHE